MHDSSLHWHVADAHKQNDKALCSLWEAVNLLCIGQHKLQGFARRAVSSICWRGRLFISNLSWVLQIALGEPIPEEFQRFGEEHLRYLKLEAWSTQSLSDLFLSLFLDLQMVRLPHALLIQPVTCERGSRSMLWTSSRSTSLHTADLFLIELSQSLLFRPDACFVNRQGRLVNGSNVCCRWFTAMHVHFDRYQFVQLQYLNCRSSKFALPFPVGTDAQTECSMPTACLRYVV